MRAALRNKAMLHLRPESAADHAVVRTVNTRAFGRPGEADLVDALRRTATPFVSLVAEEADRVVGHICFTPVMVETSGDDPLLMGLAPMAVLPEQQRQGIGSALVRAGLEACRALGADAVVVLGHPAYYPRFGFRPAEAFGLRCIYDVPPDAFMALELRNGALDDVHGTVRYHAAFDAVD